MRRVLVICQRDDTTLRIAETLVAAKCIPLTTTSVLSGVALARDNKPDVIVCDVELSAVSGAPLLKLLRVDPETSRIPVITVGSQESQAGTLAPDFTDEALLEAVGHAVPAAV